MSDNMDNRIEELFTDMVVYCTEKAKSIVDLIFEGLLSQPNTSENMLLYAKNFIAQGLYF